MPGGIPVPCCRLPGPRISPRTGLLPLPLAPEACNPCPCWTPLPDSPSSPPCPLPFPPPSPPPRDGYLTAPDVKLFFEALGEQVTLGEVQELIRQVDRSGAGKVGFEEFFEMATASTMVAH